MIKENIKKILEEISHFPQKISLVAVTKKRSIEEIKEVIEAGIINIGENRIQEAEIKFKDLNTLYSIPYTLYKKHLIGHLQSNKVKKAVELFDVIQSVDSFELLEKIDKEAEKQNKKIEIMLEVNIFDDENKFGFQPDDLIDNVEAIHELSLHIKIIGLMTIAKQGISEKETLEGFKKLADLQKKLTTNHRPLTTLSMGMSQDYKIALAAGSNMIRIGSKIFE